MQTLLRKTQKARQVKKQDVLFNQSIFWPSLQVHFKVEMSLYI